MNLSIEDGLLKIDLSRVEKVLSVHGSFRTPLEQVESVSTGVPRQSWRDLRVPGTFLPWVVKAGTYLTERGREFWYVTRNRGFLTIELKNGTTRGSCWVSMTTSTGLTKSSPPPKATPTSEDLP